MWDVVSPEASNRPRSYHALAFIEASLFGVVVGLAIAQFTVYHMFPLNDYDYDNPAVRLFADRLVIGYNFLLVCFYGMSIGCLGILGGYLTRWRKPDAKLWKRAVLIGGGVAMLLMSIVGALLLLLV